MCCWLKSSSWVHVVQTCYPVSQTRVNLKPMNLLQCLWVCIKQRMLQNWQVVTDMIICQFCNITELINLIKVLTCGNRKAVLECVWYRRVKLYHKIELVWMSLTVIWYWCASNQARDVTELTNRYRIRLQHSSQINL
jgi:hypothetical protein